MQEQALQYFRGVVGDSYVLTGANDLETYGRDWTKIFPPKAGVIVLPASTEQVVKIVKYCAANKLALVRHIVFRRSVTVPCPSNCGSTTR